MNKHNVKLDNRLKMCASFVRQDAKLVDVGTDHAYLPVWLLQNNIINSALAVDINSEPLNRGFATIEKYNAQEKIKTRLSDGLESVKREECTDIVIAGMGGELILSIIDECNWLLDNNINLILQPMTRPEVLREYLYDHNFEILSEKAVESENKLYSVINCVYHKGMIKKFKITDLYLGKLNPNKNIIDKLYVEKLLNSLNRKKLGLEKSSNRASLKNIENLIQKISDCIVDIDK